MAEQLKLFLPIRITYKQQCYELIFNYLLPNKPLIKQNKSQICTHTTQPR